MLDRVPIFRRLYLRYYTFRCVGSSDLEGSQIWQDAHKLASRESRLPAIIRVLVQSELVLLFLQHQDVWTWHDFKDELRDLPLQTARGYVDQRWLETSWYRRPPGRCPQQTETVRSPRVWVWTPGRGYSWHACRQGNDLKTEENSVDFNL
jgi:hypothetical protein